MASMKALLFLILCTTVTSYTDIVLNDFPPYLIKGETYRGLLENGVNKLITQCKQYKIKNIKWIQHKTGTEDELMKRLRENTTMFALPIPVEVGEKIGQYYRNRNDSTVQVIQSKKDSNWILIVDIERCRDELSSEIFRTIWKQSPILPMMLLVAAIAGVILWILEARHNHEEFSSSFFRGTFDGFWWAFITMTTVGYGDKTPRTVLGKVFGMIWVTIGIVIISFFTATVASTITIATVEKSCHTLKNRNVAIISNDKKVKDYVMDRGPRNVEDFNNFTAMFNTWQKNKKGGINSMFVEEHIALKYFHDNKGISAIKKLRVTKTTKDVDPTRRTTLFYAVVQKQNTSEGLPCKVNEIDFKKHFSIDDLPKPPEMYKTGFEEEVDQPFSINSPETETILIILSGFFGSLAVSGYIGISLINCVKGKKKKGESDIVEASSQENESSALMKRRMVHLQQSLDVIAQEVKGMREVLNSRNA